jgi:2-polyprenyl-6-methoxyphenol hydroxylase-like FAD-dependent oxidoreductase
MWDVIIVGARIAGCATALRFARSGQSVLVLDKGRLGSETLSTHAFITQGVQQIQSLGLMDAIAATGAPRVTYAVFDPGDNPIVMPMEDPPGFSICVRRTKLDPIFVEAAQAAGATVRHENHVERLLWDDGRVAGVRGRDANGKPFEERARLVVGADGRHSLVAREVGAPSYNQAESGTGAFYAYWQGVGPLSGGPGVLQFAAGPECDTLNSPCDGNEHIIVLIVGPREFPTLLDDSSSYETRLQSIPALAPRLTHARRTSRIYPASPRELQGYFRKPFGPGWALAGDAGLCPHPAIAHGMTDALRSAELLHQYTEQAWTAGQQAEDCLESYQQTRDAESTPWYYAGYAMSQLNALRNPEVLAKIPH